MRYPTTPNPPPAPGSQAITILRVILWLVPAFMLPFGIVFSASLGAIWPLGALVTIAAFAAVGYFDQRLSLQQKRIDPSAEKKELIRWTIIFVVLQAMIAPAIGCTVLYGFCMITDSGFL